PLVLFTKGKDLKRHRKTCFSCFRPLTPWAQALHSHHSGRAAGRCSSRPGGRNRPPPILCRRLRRGRAAPVAGVGLATARKPPMKGRPPPALARALAAVRNRLRGTWISRWPLTFLPARRAGRLAARRRPSPHRPSLETFDTRLSPDDVGSVVASAVGLA